MAQRKKYVFRFHLTTQEVVMASTDNENTAQVVNQMLEAEPTGLAWAFTPWMDGAKAHEKARAAGQEVLQIRTNLAQVVATEKWVEWS